MRTKTIKLNEEQTIDYLVAQIASQFRSFGGGSSRGIGTNPIAEALRDHPAQFAAGVDIKSVVTFILKELE